MACTALIIMASLAFNMASDLYGTGETVFVEQNDGSSEEENTAENQEKDTEFRLPGFDFCTMSKAEWLYLHQGAHIPFGHSFDVVTPPPEFEA